MNLEQLISMHNYDSYNVPAAGSNTLKHTLFSPPQTEDSKEQVAICLQRDALDRIPGSNWADQHHSPTTNSTSHNAELQDATFPTAYFTAPGTQIHLCQLPHSFELLCLLITFQY